jgi:hypothetical protein
MMQHPCRYTELPLAQSRGYSIAYEYQRKIMQEIAEVVAAFASLEIQSRPGADQPAVAHAVRDGDAAVTLFLAPLTAFFLLSTQEGDCLRDHLRWCRAKPFWASSARCLWT